MIVHKWHIVIIEDMHAGALTGMRSCCGITTILPVILGLHQISALSPYFFALIVDELTDNIQKGVP